MDVFEDVSKNSKKEKFTSDTDTVQDKADKSTEVALAEIQEKLFSVKNFFTNRHSTVHKL